MTDIINPSRDGTLDLVLTDDGEPVRDLSAITRIVFTLGSVTVDSDLDADAITWGNRRDIEGAPCDFVAIRHAALAGLSGVYQGELVTYDADHPNGLSWTDYTPVEAFVR